MCAPVVCMELFWADSSGSNSVTLQITWWSIYWQKSYPSFFFERGF